MKSKEVINNQIEETLKVLEDIQEVKVNHFFKHKVLQQITIENEKNHKQTVFSWFTPQLQLATLGLILLLNLFTIFYAFSSQKQNPETGLENFAQEYSLNSETTYLLN